jgi:hypothetical protein
MPTNGDLGFLKDFSLYMLIDGANLMFSNLLIEINNKENSEGPKLTYP